MLLNKYVANFDGVKFDIKFHDMFTLINGESGIGKTMLFKSMQNEQLLGRSDFVCLDYRNIDNNDINQTLKSSKNKIIAIDNGDIALTEDQKLFVSLDTNNQYIVFAHVAMGFKPSGSSIAILKTQDNKLILEYPFLNI